LPMCGKYVSVLLFYAVQQQLRSAYKPCNRLPATYSWRRCLVNASIWCYPWLTPVKS